jgi:formylmethanofuran dehydrogenase subunit E
MRLEGLHRPHFQIGLRCQYCGGEKFTVDQKQVTWSGSDWIESKAKCDSCGEYTSYRLYEDAA